MLSCSSTIEKALLQRSGVSFLSCSYYRYAMQVVEVMLFICYISALRAWKTLR